MLKNLFGFSSTKENVHYTIILDVIFFLLWNQKIQQDKKIYLTSAGKKTTPQTHEYKFNWFWQEEEKPAHFGQMCSKLLHFYEEQSSETSAIAYKFTSHFAGEHDNNALHTTMCLNHFYFGRRYQDVQKLTNSLKFTWLCAGKDPHCTPITANSTSYFGIG